MKLASIKNGRDGSLVVVSRYLTRAVFATKIAPTLQAALDDWENCAPKLHNLYIDLCRNSADDSFALDLTKLASPLPRAYQWLDGSAYLNHVELVRKARGAEMPKEFLHDPLMYQGCSDSFLDPTEDIVMASEDYGIDFESEVAVITDDVPMGIAPAQAAKHIKLLMLVNDVSLRSLIPAELGKGFGFVVSKPASSFSPIAVTPDELGDAWKDCKLHLPLRTVHNGELFGHPNAGVDMQFSFADLISHGAKTRNLCAGTIIGSGTISNRDKSKGSSCIAEKRMLETIEAGKPITPFLRFGDRVKIEMLAEDGHSVFGAIDQSLRQS